MRRTTLAWLVVTAIAALVPNATTAQLSAAHLIGEWAGDNVLSWGGERFQTSLTIYGEQMKGTRFGGQRPWLITLQKKR